MITFDKFLPDVAGGVSQGNLEIIRVNETPVLVNVFTPFLAAVSTHYLDFSNLRGEVRCNAGLEPRCLLCDERFKETRRAILPVLDVASDQVKVLLISDTISPHALAPQIRAKMQEGDLDKRSLLISRISHKFRVESVPARTGQNMGEIAIADFARQLKSGQLSLESAVTVRTNLQLWDIPELARRAEALGLSRSDYALGGQTEAPTK